MTERWATFDCYGTLVDWHAGIRSVVEKLWPGVDSERLLERHQTIEPLVQEGRGIAYREVGARTLRAMAAIEDLPLESTDDYALAESLPDWPVFAEVPLALQTLRRDGWRLAILSNTDPDLLAASIQRIGVPIDLLITAREAGSYKPAPGHWQRFFELSGADRARYVHVGASAFHDLAAAERLGLPAVWINRLAEHSSLSRAGELPDLRGLPELVDRLISTTTPPR